MRKIDFGSIIGTSGQIRQFYYDPFLDKFYITIEHGLKIDRFVFDSFEIQRMGVINTEPLKKLIK